MSIEPISGRTKKQIQAQSSSKSATAYFLLFAIGLLIFFTITFTFSFKEKVFRSFFEKPFSFAMDEGNSPMVELTAGVDNLDRSGVVNIDNIQPKIVLKWKTGNLPGGCFGRFWSDSRESDQWTGPKDPKGGEYALAETLTAGINLYSINCSNEFGDSSGSTVVINAGAKNSNLEPRITSFQATGEDNKQYEPSKLNVVRAGTVIKISWSGINLATRYGVCIANGSWPTVYKDIQNKQIKEEFRLEKGKTYQYSIFCSNESGYDSQSISFIAR